jgi:hypothetical protein
MMFYGSAAIANKDRIPFPPAPMRGMYYSETGASNAPAEGDRAAA